MKFIELDLWQTILLGGMLIGGFTGVLKMLLAQQMASINAGFTGQNMRLDKIEATNLEESGSWKRLERELLTLKADLPLAYVRRDDYIRGQSVLESKIDSLAMKLENAQLRTLYTQQRNNPGAPK